MRLDGLTGETPAAATVRRRRVFYIPGFDPSPARRYRELYRREGAAQAALSGYRLAQGPGADAAGWQVAGSFDGVTVETRFSVLVWSDLVQTSLARSPFGITWPMLRTLWLYLASGALLQLMRLRKGPMLAALYPVAMILTQAGLALAAGWIAGAVLAAQAGIVAAIVAGCGTALALMRWFDRLDGRLLARYLMRDYAFFAQAGGAYPAALEWRLALFRDEIAAATAGDWDEVLVVGHSSGAALAVSVVADLVRGNAVPGRPALALLTLGQVIPKLSVLPGAHRLRADLRAMSQRSDVTWVDVTAPGDGCCFALCDPVAVAGVAPDGGHGPLVISAAFRQTLRPETLARLRWRFFRAHFQYLCAFDNLAGAVSDYDYFRVTAGPMTLAARFAVRAHSPSRIDVPVVRLRGVAA